MSTARRVVCASARAFTHPKKKGGGNPVDIFMAPSTTTSKERINLAKSCSWESIVIDNTNADLPKFHFYMPSGEEVSFCGHAAIGACSFLANEHSIISSASEEESNNNILLQQSSGSISFQTAVEGLLYAAKVSKNQVELIMNTKHYEQEYSSSQLQCCSEDLLSEIGLSNKDVSSDSDTLPLFINSSVARYKTLIPISSIETLHAATNPKDPDKFRDLCESIDSTGIYLYSIYTNKEETKETVEEKSITLECRQFPKSSGYQEDPATGIAAGALVCSLYKRGINVEYFDILQGTAMNRPSKIKVKIDSYQAKETNPSIKISYTGEVVFDKISYHDLE